jgi:hypothetical protein
MNKKLLTKIAFTVFCLGAIIVVLAFSTSNIELTWGMRIAGLGLISCGLIDVWTDR